MKAQNNASTVAAPQAFPVVYAILLAGVVLRLVGLNTSALWYDEAFSVVITRQDLLEMIRSLTVNLSPPGWEILVWFSMHALGYAEWSARLIPFLASVGTLWITYLLTRELRFSAWQTVVVLTLLAVLPYQLWIAHEVRMYAVFAFLYTLGILKVFQGRWLGLCATMGLMFWMHNTALLYGFALFVLALFWRPREWKWILGATFVAGLVWLPWAAVFFMQAQSNLIGFPPFTFSHFATNLEAAFFANTLQQGWQLFGFLAIVLASLAALWKTFQPVLVWCLPHSRRMREENAHLVWDDLHATGLIMLAVMIPFGLLVLVSLWSQNIFWYRTMSSVIPAWICLVAPTFVIPLEKSKAASISTVLLQVLWAVVMIVALVGWLPASRGSHLHEVVELMRDEWKPGDIVYHAAGTTAVLFSFYLPKVPQYLLNEKSSVGKQLVDMVKTNTTEAALENIPYRRAWIIWSHDEVTIKMKEHVEERMAEYVKDCQIIDRMYYWQHWTTEIFLCVKP